MGRQYYINLLLSIEPATQTKKASSVMLPKILCKNPKKGKTLRLLSLSVWGAPASLGTKDKTERVSFKFLSNIKGVFSLQNECKCNIPPDWINRSFHRRLKRVRPGASSRPLDETRSWNNSSSTAKGDSKQVESFLRKNSILYQLAESSDDSCGGLGTSSLWWESSSHVVQWARPCLQVLKRPPPL